MDEWLRPGIRLDALSRRYDEVQLDMDGYDENHYMETDLIKLGRHSKLGKVAVCLCCTNIRD